jgi:hypothetical protein
MNANIQKILDKVTDVVTSEEATRFATAVVATATVFVMIQGARFLRAVIENKVEEIGNSSSNS